MTPLAKIAIFGHPPSKFCTPLIAFQQHPWAGRKSVRIASLFSLFSFAIFSQLDQTNFSRFRSTLSSGFDCWLCYFRYLRDLRPDRRAGASTIMMMLSWRRRRRISTSWRKRPMRSLRRSREQRSHQRTGKSQFRHGSPPYRRRRDARRIHFSYCLQNCTGAKADRLFAAQA